MSIDGTEDEDGDESPPLAVRAARPASAHFVIAVDVTPRPGTEQADILQSLRGRVAGRPARIVLEPRAPTT